MNDFKDLPKDLKDKMLKWEQQSPANLQLKALQEIVNKTQSVVSELNNLQIKDEKNSGNMGSLLIDIRESLDNMAAQEAPESPDYSKPIVDAVSSLKVALNASIKSIDVKPNVNVSSPTIKVDAPKLDLSGIEKILKTDIPKAFELAIKAMPDDTPNDYTPLLEKFDEMSIILQSIDTASRLKPQAPGTLKVTNPDGSYISSTAGVTERYDYSVPTSIYTGTAAIGTADASTGWTIILYDLASSSAASGKVATNVSWTNRASGSFS